MFGTQFASNCSRLLHSGDLDDMRDAILCDFPTNADHQIDSAKGQKTPQADRIVTLKRCA